jgi:hypothetical protein
MSIVACVKVYDGIALGADSATQIMTRDQAGNVIAIKTYHNARKIFQFQDKPVGILTYGIGNLGNKSIETLLREYNIAHPLDSSSEYKVNQISDNLFKHFNSLYNQQFQNIPTEQKPGLGFFIAGYSHNEPLGEEFEFVLPKDSISRPVRPSDKFGASWRGVSVPFTRLYYGFDPRLEEKLLQSGREDTIPLIQSIKQEFSSKVIYDGMPIIDAIKFVNYILLTTIGIVSFEIGFPTCSEPVDIAVIMEDKFDWVKKKELKTGIWR